MAGFVEYYLTGFNRAGNRGIQEIFHALSPDGRGYCVTIHIRTRFIVNAYYINGLCL